MGDSSQYPFAELDGELHECHLPKMQRGRVYTCECGCIWEAIGLARHARWALTRDPDRAVG